MIQFEDDSEGEHLRNFKKISDDLKAFEDEYRTCLMNIPSDNFQEDAIQTCLGNDFLKVQQDMKYETFKIQSRGDETVRELMIEHCYIKAGGD